MPNLNADLVDGVAFYSAPLADNAWVVLSSTSDLSYGNAENLEAHARWWNPHANVAEK